MSWAKCRSEFPMGATLAGLGKPIHLQLYELDGKPLQVDGLRIGGQYSRAMPQKPSIFLPATNMVTMFEYPFFLDRN